MDRQQLKQEAQSLTDRYSLLALLNRLKRDNLGEKARLFNMYNLRYFSKPGCNARHYRSFMIPKKSGGVRDISTPTGILKSLQSNMAILLEALYEPSSSVCGFVHGRSVKDNAVLHVGKNYVFNIDIKDFFPSISQARVWGALQADPIGLSREVASTIAGTCCTLFPFCDGQLVTTENGDLLAEAPYVRSVLPQGSPASPILTNIVCQNLDRRLRGLARRFGLTYSRYADDITFSSMHNVYQKDSEFIKELRRIIEDQNFKLNDKKTRLQKRGERQIVTGLVVNEKVNVSRKYIRSIGSLLYIWERYGYDSAVASFLKYGESLSEESVFPKMKFVSMEDVIRGRLSYLAMIKGKNDPPVAKLMKRFQGLIDAKAPKKQDINYISSYTVEEFCDLFGTSVNISIHDLDTDARIQASAIIDGKTHSIWISDYCNSQFKSRIEDSKDSTRLVSLVREQLMQMTITLCESMGGTFWLVMKSRPRDRYFRSAIENYHSR